MIEMCVRVVSSSISRVLPPLPMSRDFCLCRALSDLPSLVARSVTLRVCPSVRRRQAFSGEKPLPMAFTMSRATHVARGSSASSVSATVTSPDLLSSSILVLVESSTSFFTDPSLPTRTPTLSRGILTYSMSIRAWRE
jgi:hypothetical protein